MNKKTLNYHVSIIDLGEKIIFHPRIPAPASHFGISEPSIPRVCVAPTIEGCIWASESFGKDITLYVYATNSEAVDSYNVHDSKITGERWIIKSATFKKIGVFQAKELPFFGFGKETELTPEIEKKLNYIRELLKTNLVLA